MAKRKKWSLAHSKLHWVTVSPAKVWTLCWILPFAPPTTGTYPSSLPPPPSPSGMPFNIDIVIKKTTFNLIKKLPSKNIVTRKQKNHSTEVNYGSILQILVPSLTRIVSSNKSASLKMKFSCHRTKNILSFSREAVFSQQLPSR